MRVGERANANADVAGQRASLPSSNTAHFLVSSVFSSIRLSSIIWKPAACTYARTTPGSMRYSAAVSLVSVPCTAL
jgi:hypothetical protein